jgi:hypothetical protein
VFPKLSISFAPEIDICSCIYIYPYSANVRCKLLIIHINIMYNNNIIHITIARFICVNGPVIIYNISVDIRILKISGNILFRKYQTTEQFDTDEGDQIYVSVTTCYIRGWGETGGRESVWTLWQRENLSPLRIKHQTTAEQPVVLIVSLHGVFRLRKTTQIQRELLPE